MKALELGHISDCTVHTILMVVVPDMSARTIETNISLYHMDNKKLNIAAN